MRDRSKGEEGPEPDRTGGPEEDEALAEDVAALDMEIGLNKTK